MPEYEKRTQVSVSQAKVFEWHTKEGTLSRLLTPWDKITLVRKDRSLKPGTKVILKIKKYGLSFKWIAKHTHYNPPNSFVDIQKKGPFASWKHLHEFVVKDENHSELVDKVYYQTPLGLGKKSAANVVDRMFEYRHKVTKNDLEVHKKYGKTDLKFGITGATGLVGSALKSFLECLGHKVISIDMRKKTNMDQLNGLHGVVNLAGANIASKRWSEKYKSAIYESRVNGTKELVDLLNKLDSPPKVLISASAVGIHNKNSFISDLCQKWEDEAMEFKNRVVTPRLGVVLSAKGGALAKMLPSFKLGLGAVLGSGEQPFNWIYLDDVVYSIYRFLLDQSVSGQLNLWSTHAVTNVEFTKAMGKVLRRPTFLRMPDPIAKFLFGQMATEALLWGAKEGASEKAVLLYSDLEKSLRHALGIIS